MNCGSYGGGGCGKSRATGSLDGLISDYEQRLQSRLSQELDWFSSASGVEQAIVRGVKCEYADGTLHSHQRRIGRARLAGFIDPLMNRKSDIAQCEDFDGLFRVVDEEASRYNGIGDLAVYDIAMRIGVALGLSPDRVYLHAGAKQGARNLGIPSRSRSVPMMDLPEPLRRLSPDDVENFLCIYKERLAA